MRSFRIIPRLDIKQDYLIKGVQMEGWRKVGDPKVFAKRYYEAGADEILLMDVVASLYGRNSLHELIKTVHPHPTLSEAIMEAAAAAYDEVIHL